MFIRFKGCNLNCSYCDTKWANEPACDYEELSPDDICEYVSETGIKNVTLTGGEPLLQKDIRSLVEKLLNKSDIRVEIETNGAVDIAPLANAFSKEKLSLTMDYKLPSSGCEEKNDSLQYGSSKKAGHSQVCFGQCQGFGMCRENNWKISSDRKVPGIHKSSIWFN